MGKLIADASDGGEPGAPRLLTIDIGTNALGAENTGISIPLAELDGETLARLTPDIVVFPLFSPNQDAMTVIDRLEELGYRGRMTVICPKLPRPMLVQAELRSHGPGERLSLLILAADQTAGLSRK